MKRLRLSIVPPTDEQLAEASVDGTILPAALRDQLTLRYKTLVQTALRTPLERAGVTIEEMEKSLAILKKVTAVSDDAILDLEDAEHAYLVAKLAAVRWAGFDERIVTFVHTVQNATNDLLDEPVADEAVPDKPQ